MDLISLGGRETVLKVHRRAIDAKPRGPLKVFYLKISRSSERSPFGRRKVVKGSLTFRSRGHVLLRVCQLADCSIDGKF